MKLNISYLGPSFDYIDKGAKPMSVSGSGASLSRPRTLENVPSTARSKRRYTGKKWNADYFVVDCGPACNGRFRALVEQFEPGKHLFAPIELQNNDGSVLEGEFYYFSTQQDIDCILTGNDPEWFEEIGGRIIPTLKQIYLPLSPLSPPPTRKVYLSKPQVEGKHLWTGGPLGYNQLFFSNEFYAAFKKGKFKFLDVLSPCIEVDRPWVAEENMGPLLDVWRNYVAHDRDVGVGY